ncbi:MAG: zinc ribbon domain-containing protein [Planctomycetota bacterium]
MAFDLDALLTLGELDKQRLRLRQRLARAADLAAPQQARVDKVRRELQALDEEGKAGQREVKRLELEAKGKEAEVEKNQISLNQVKNNDEYQALLRTIEARKQELGELETRILEAYDAQEERDGRVRAGKERLASQEQELAAARGRVAQEEGLVQGELSGVEAKRAEAAARLDPAHLELYERLLKNLGDSAIAEVVDQHCQGCLMKIRPEQVSLIRGRQTMVVCADCGRILWGTFPEGS